jgi:hypothetical protein
MSIKKKIERAVYRVSGSKDKDELYTLANQNHLDELDEEGKKEYQEAAKRLLDKEYFDV